MIPQKLKTRGNQWWVALQHNDKASCGPIVQDLGFYPTHPNEYKLQARFCTIILLNNHHQTMQVSKFAITHVG